METDVEFQDAQALAQNTFIIYERSAMAEAMLYQT